MFCRECGSMLRDDAIFCPNCGMSTVKTQQTSEKSSPTWNTNNFANNQKTGTNIGKVINDIISSFIKEFIIILILNLFLNYATGYDIFGNFIYLLRNSFLISLLYAIPEIIIIMLRIGDPNDTAYEIGSTQDEATNYMFKQKYQTFSSISEWAITIFIIILNIRTLFYMIFN